MKPFSKQGFTLIEMLVVIAIIALLASIMIPAVSKTKQKADAVKCMHNLNQIGLAVTQYTMAHNEKLPVSNETSSGNDPRGWRLVIAPYLGLDTSQWWADNVLTTSVFRCPSFKRGPGHNARWDGGYGWNYRYMGHRTNSTGYSERQKMYTIPNPAETVLVADTTEGKDTATDYKIAYLYRPTGGGGAPTPAVGTRHRNGINILWADMHVGWMSQDQLTTGKNGNKNWYYEREK
ncbi:type II secretion system protein [Kiritimatiellaeota bacterium B1221]|nr:type II secretion system protein [Kiritimatiellaeota bacterium B1221]